MQYFLAHKKLPVILRIFFVVILHGQYGVANDLMFQLSKCIPVRHIFTLVQGEEVLPSLVFKAFYICFCIVYSFVLYIMCYIPFIQLQNCPVLALRSFTLFGVFTICVYIYIIQR